MPAKSKAPPPPVDPASEVLPLLNAFLDQQGDDWDIHDVALKFRNVLENQHVAAWEAYADEHWAGHFETLIRRRMSEIRAAARHAQTRSVARKRVNERVLTGMSQTSYGTDNRGRFKRLMAMSKLELLEVAGRYEKTGNTQLKQAAFLRVVAKKLKGAQKVSDAWTIANIEKQARTIFGPAADDLLADVEASA